MSLRLGSGEPSISNGLPRNLGVRQIMLLLCFLTVAGGDLLAQRINLAYSKSLPQSIRTHVDDAFTDDIFSGLRVQGREVDVVNLFVGNNPNALGSEADSAFGLEEYEDIGENELFISMSPEGLEKLSLTVKTAIEGKFSQSDGRAFFSLLEGQLGPLKQQLMNRSDYDGRIETIEWVNALIQSLENIRDEQSPPKSRSSRPSESQTPISSSNPSSSEQVENNEPSIPDPIKYIGFVLLILTAIGGGVYGGMKLKKSELEKLQEVYEKYTAYEERVNRVKKKAEWLKVYMNQTEEYISPEMKRKIVVILDMMELVEEQLRLQKELMKEFTEKGNLIKIVRARNGLEDALADLSLHENKLEECDENCDYISGILKLEYLESVIEGTNFDLSNLNFGDLGAVDNFLEDPKALSVFSNEEMQAGDIVHIELVSTNTDWIYDGYDQVAGTINDYEELYTMRATLLSSIQTILAEHGIMQDVVLDENEDGVVTTLEKTKDLKERLPELKKLVVIFQDTTKNIYTLQQATLGYSKAHTEYVERYKKQTQEIADWTTLYPQLANFPPRKINDTMRSRGTENVTVGELHELQEKDRPSILSSIKIVDSESEALITSYTGFNDAYEGYNELVEACATLESKLKTESPYNQEMFNSPPGIESLQRTVESTLISYQEVQESIRDSESPQQTQNRLDNHGTIVSYNNALEAKRVLIHRYHTAYLENLKKIEEFKKLKDEYIEIADSIGYSQYLNDSLVTSGNFFEKNTANGAVLRSVEGKLSSIKAKEKKLNDLLGDFKELRSKVLRYYKSNSGDISSYVASSISNVSPDLRGDYQSRLDSITTKIGRLNSMKGIMSSEVYERERERERARQAAAAAQAAIDEANRKARQAQRAQQACAASQARSNTRNTSNQTGGRTGGSI